MERRLSINVSAVNVDLVVVKQRDDIMDIGMGDGVEHNVAANLFNVSNHNLNLQL